MVIKFNSKLEGIDWIAEKVENETQFEVLREMLLFNFIYTGTYYLEIDDTQPGIYSGAFGWKLGHDN